MVQTPTKPLTLAEFLALPETEPASEYIRAQILQKPMPKGKHSILQGKLVPAINSVTETARIALAFPELRCTFDGRSIVPDIAVFLWERLPINEDGTIADDFKAHPDWMIEILSPDQSATKLMSKILHCLKQGCQLGWQIDPAERSVLVYFPDQKVELFQAEGVGEASPSENRLPVPGFAADLQLSIEQLFGWLTVG